MIMEATATALICFGMPASRGNSDTARYIAERRLEGREHLQQSNAFGTSAKVTREKLVQVFEECQKPSWDGYGALAVTNETYQLAYRLLEALPLGAPTPSFGAEADGQLTFEWHRSARRTLSVSVSQEGDLHYAALIGSSKVYGTEPFFGEVPKTILDLIARVNAV